MHLELNDTGEASFDPSFRHHFLRRGLPHCGAAVHGNSVLSANAARAAPLLTCDGRFWRPDRWKRAVWGSLEKKAYGL